MNCAMASIPSTPQLAVFVTDFVALDICHLNLSGIIMHRTEKYYKGYFRKRF
jgi:hypothetical protein